MIWSVSMSFDGERDRVRREVRELSHVPVWHERRHDNIVRTSVILPVIAAAAAVSGEARNVRPPLPWRPSKLRLLVLTAYWPGSS